MRARCQGDNVSPTVRDNISPTFSYQEKKSTFIFEWWWRLKPFGSEDIFLLLNWRFSAEGKDKQPKKCVLVNQYIQRQFYGINSAGLWRNGGHIYNLKRQYHIYFGNLQILMKKRTAHRSLLLRSLMQKEKAKETHYRVIMLRQENEKQQKRQTWFITYLAVPCNGMLFKSPAPLNTLLHGCNPKQKPPSLYPWRSNPNGPFDAEARSRKHPGSRFSWQALPFWVLTWVFAQGQQVNGTRRGGGLAVQYPWFCECSPQCCQHVWHMPRRIIISAAVTQTGPVLRAHSINPIK